MSLACTCIPAWQYTYNIQHESIQTVPNQATAIVHTGNMHVDQHKLSIHTHINIKSQGKSVLHNAVQKMLFADHKAYLQALHKSSLEVSSRHKTVHICQWAENGLLLYQHIWRSGIMNTHIYINNCPMRCNTEQSIYYSASSLYTFRVSTTPIIRSTQNCKCSLWYWSYFLCGHLCPWSSS